MFKSTTRPIAALLSLAALVFSACENVGSDPSGGKSGLLMGSQWKLTDHTVAPGIDLAGDGVLVTELFAAEGGCMKDDTTAFSADGKWTVEQGESKCHPDDPQVETGRWSLAEAGTRLNLHSDLEPSPTKYKVLTLTETTLRLSLKYEELGREYEDILTFTAL